jgi:HTH-type transcriptional regulator/antitoxin HigA
MSDIEVLPPGRFLVEILNATGRTQVDLARSTEMSTKHVSQIVTGKVPISVSVARELQRTTGVPARVWLALEAQWALTDTDS